MKYGTIFRSAAELTVHRLLYVVGVRGRDAAVVLSLFVGAGGGAAATVLSGARLLTIVV